MDFSKKFTTDLLDQFLEDTLDLVDREKKMMTNMSDFELHGSYFGYTGPITDRSVFLDFFIQIVHSVDQKLLSEFNGAETLHRFIETLHYSFQCSHRGDWTILSMNYVYEIAVIIGAEEFQKLFQPKVMDLLSLYTSSIINTSALRKVLSIYLKILTLQSPNLNHAVSRFMTTEFLSLRLNRDPEVSSLTVQIYRAIFGVELSENIHTMFSILKEELSILKESFYSTEFKHEDTEKSGKKEEVENTFPRSNNKFQFKESKPQKKGISLGNYFISSKDALKLVALDLVILGAISKNCPIQRDLAYDFLLQHYHPYDEILSSTPILQLSSISSIFSLASKKQLLLSDPVLLKILISSLESTCPKIKMFTIDWITKEVSMRCDSEMFFLARSTPHIPLQVFTTLICLTNDKDERVRVNLANQLIKLASLRCFDEQQITDIVSVAIIRLADTRKPVAKAYMSLLQTISAAIILSDQFILYDRKTKTVSSLYYYLSKPQGSAWKERLIGKKEGLEPSLFQRHHFIKIMNFISSFGVDEETQGLDWISRIAYCCDAIASIRTNELDELGDSFLSFLSNSSSISRTVAYFWALLECARFCVHSKLRTPFGTPAQTFEVVQKMVLKVHALTEISNHEAHQTTQNKKDLTWRRYQKHTRQLVVQLLLQFLDHFEKQIFNAYEGSINLPPVVNPTVLQFFKANKRACIEWFAHRVRHPLLLASIAANSPADVIRYLFRFILRF